MARPRWNAKPPEDRAIVLTYQDGLRLVVPVSDDCTLTVRNDRTGERVAAVAFKGVTDLTLEGRELAELERDALAPLPDLGTPVSEWDYLLDLDLEEPHP